YEGGLSVRTTLDPELEAIAETVLRRGLVAYDRRHGWRGPFSTLSASIVDADAWVQALREMNISLGAPSWRLAAVLEIKPELARIGLPDGRTGVIPLSELEWAGRLVK